MVLGGGEQQITIVIVLDASDATLVAFQQDRSLFCGSKQEKGPSQRVSELVSWLASESVIE